jgi:hypothetical protein
MNFEPSIELMPQSMTTAPGLIQDSLTISARPMATTKMSAAAALINYDNKEGLLDCGLGSVFIAVPFVPSLLFWSGTL